MSESEPSPDIAPGVEEAAEPFVHVSEAYRRYVQEGLDAIDRGDVHDWEDVKADLRRKYGDLGD